MSWGEVWVGERAGQGAGQGLGHGTWEGLGVKEGRGQEGVGGVERGQDRGGSSQAVGGVNQLDGTGLGRVETGRTGWGEAGYGWGRVVAEWKMVCTAQVCLKTQEQNAECRAKCEGLAVESRGDKLTIALHR